LLRVRSTAKKSRGMSLRSLIQKKIENDIHKQNKNLILNKNYKKTNHFDTGESSSSSTTSSSPLDSTILDDDEFIAAHNHNRSSSTRNHQQTSSKATNSVTSKNNEEKKITFDDSLETQLSNLIASCHIKGIEELLLQVKGVPGRAVLRKNAKKALKRLKEDLKVSKIINPDNASDNESNATDTVATSKSTSEQGLGFTVSSDNTHQIAVYKPPEPLLKLISHTHNRPVTSSRISSCNSNNNNSNSSTPAAGTLFRSECIMHMAPSVVGWVIGKGGQRIRELMEESGAKVWIDQESMGSKESRIVYVSGQKKQVECAVRMVKDLVAKAPMCASSSSHTSTLKSHKTSNTPITTSTPTASLEKQSQSSDNASLSSSSKMSSSRSPVLTASSLPLYSVTTGNTSTTSNNTKPNVENTVTTTGSTYPKSKIVSLPKSLTFLDSMTAASSTVNITPNIDVFTKVVKCEPRFVPLLIGRRGWTIKHIQDASGARVDIDQTVTPRLIKISGKSSNVQTAFRMVNDVLSYPHAQLHYNDEENAKMVEVALKAGVEAGTNSSVAAVTSSLLLLSEEEKFFLEENAVSQKN